MFAKYPKLFFHFSVLIPLCYITIKTDTMYHRHHHQNNIYIQVYHINHLIFTNFAKDCDISFY